MTFEAWLRTQQNRTDAVGKLAREFMTYSDYMYKKHFKRIKCTKENVLTGSVKDLDLALAEYLGVKA